MKFWAILRDSVREAVDNKVLYVMLGLACLVILVVATMSFEPKPAEDMMKTLVRGDFNLFIPSQQQRAIEEREKAMEAEQAGRGIPSNFKVAKVVAVKGPQDSPDSDYAVTVVQDFPNPADAEKVRKNPGPTLNRLRKRFAGAEELELIKVADVRLLTAAKVQPPGQVTFEVRTEPTEATRRVWPNEVSFFLGALPIREGIPLGLFLFLTGVTIFKVGGTISLLTSIIITGFFIPNMLRKGTVDLLLVKPIHRWTLLIYKYIGGLTFIFLNTSFAIGGVWFALGLRSGIWANSFLLTIFAVTFYFAILYAVSTLFAVLTRSIIASILISCGVWLLLFLVGFLYGLVDQQRIREEIQDIPVEKRSSENGFAKVVGAVHFVLPRTSDLGGLISELLFSDFLTGKLTEGGKVLRTSITWGESLTVSFIFIALMLGLACWRFAKRDY
jgi:ABC-type transport system involved in multi-copper enzyme maturation permease subunit